MTSNSIFYYYTLIKKNSGWHNAKWRNHVLFYTLITSLVTTMFCVSMFLSYHTIHPDEYYQIVEFASVKLETSQIGSLPWEYFYQIRSWIQPSFFYILAKFCSYLSVVDPFIILGIWSFCSALFLFIPTMFLLFLSCNVWIKQENLRFFAVQALSLFYLLPYIGSHPISEVWGMCFFCIAFSIISLCSDFDQEKFNIGTIPLLLVGIIIGTAFQLRPHTAIFSIGLILWILYKNSSSIKKIQSFTCLGITGVITLMLFAKLDAWGYESPGYVTSFVNYYLANISQGISKKFGIESIFWYLYSIHINPAPYLSIPLMLLTYFFWCLYPKNLLTWLTLPFFVIHSFVPHKEVRFLIPMIPFCIISVFFLLQKESNTTNKYLEICRKKIISFWENPSYKIPYFLFWSNQFTIFILLIACFGGVLSFRMAGPKSDTWIPPIWNTAFTKAPLQTDSFLLKINQESITKKGYSFGSENNFSPYSSGLRGFIKSKRPKCIEISLSSEEALKRFFSKKEKIQFPVFIISGIPLQDNPNLISSILPIKAIDTFPHPILYKICSWIPVVKKWVNPPVFLYTLQENTP